MTYVQFYNEWHRLACFSVSQVRAIYPDFHRGNFVQWQRAGYIVPLRQGWYAFSDYIQQPDSARFIAGKICAPSYISLHPLVFQTINLFGLNMMPTLVVFAAMLPGLKLFEIINLKFEEIVPFMGNEIINYCLMAIGFLVCVAAATIQLISDKQIHDFRAANPGKCCNVGLWKHGRHPNYFGEISFWWGIWVMYAAFNGVDWFICGAIAMTAMFLGISIPLMEKRQLANKPEYAEYRKQTRMLI